MKLTRKLGVVCFSINLCSFGIVSLVTVLQYPQHVNYAFRAGLDFLAFALFALVSIRFRVWKWLLHSAWIAATYCLVITGFELIYFRTSFGLQAWTSTILMLIGAPAVIAMVRESLNARKSPSIRHR